MQTGYTGLLVAALGGAAIGFERQWSGHATGPLARFGGIRTFTMLGGLGGLCGWLGAIGFTPLAGVLLAGAAALVICGYLMASRVDVEATTETAALVVLAAGVVAGAGFLALASATVAATAILLVEKSRLHALAERVDADALRASVRFGAMALVVLPLLPTGPYGPFDAVRPRELWALVLFFSGLSFAGWLAERAAGPQRGLIVTGMLGGLVSSTSVTLAFARASRDEGAHHFPLAIGAIGACTVMLLRVAIAAAVLNLPLALALLPGIVFPFTIGAVALAVALRRSAPAQSGVASSSSPLRLRAALEMAILFQITLFVVLAVRAKWGSSALLATSALIGLTDLDALTLSLARSTSSSAVPATQMAATVAALATGILSNTLLKAAVALILGSGVFRWAVPVVLGLMAISVLVWLVFAA